MIESLTLLVTMLPLLGAVLVLMAPARGDGEGSTVLWRIAQVVATLTFLLSIPFWFGYGPGESGIKFQFSMPWFHIQTLQARFALGIDGLSLLLVLLTSLMGMLVLFSARSHIKSRDREFLAWMLVMECGMLGVFMSLDFFAFYVFWEVMLVPLYFIVGIWGGPARLYAAMKFFLYTMAGSVLMLLAIIWLVNQPVVLPGKDPMLSSSILDHLEHGQLPEHVQHYLFLAFVVAFAIKVPTVPFHTWLPDAHVEAPTSGSVILAGVLLKMGTYGMIRFCLPMFPLATRFYAVPLMVIGLIGLVYGAFLAWAQQDLKKLVAYSSISHLGYVVLGIFALNQQGLEGSVLQMVSHGIATPALFLLVGMIYERRHTREIADFGGLARSMPRFAFFLMLATFASVGLPGLSGFVGEFLILIGTYLAVPLIGGLAALGIIFGAVYMLSMMRRVVFGRLTSESNRSVKDLNLRECLVLVPLAVLFFWIGLHPTSFTSRTAKTLETIKLRVEKG
ncbi:MAG: NuoM family protein [Planctomycetota bacterium]